MEDNTSTVEKETKNRSSLVRTILSYLFIFIFTIAVGTLFRVYVVTPTVVSGSSMYPTLHNDDKIMLNKVTPLIKGYERFDVVVFKHSDTEYYVKRIIGVPGDTVSYSDDTLYVNNKPYKENYLNYSKTTLDSNELLTEDFSLDTLYGVHKVPKGYYFVLGDNRKKSNDSRNSSDVGMIPKSKMVGKAFIRYAPVKNMSIIKHEAQ